MSRPERSDLGQDHSLSVIAIAVGNSRTRIGLVEAGGISDAVTFANTPSQDGAAAAPPIAEMAAAVARLGASSHALPVVIASVNDAVADLLERALGDQPAAADRVYRVGRDVPIPIRHTIDPGSIIGQDRLLCALAAFDRARQACVVIDAGTAITVDFVDGQGVFHGGAIAPGAAMMLRSLHEGTALLPRLTPEPLPADAAPWGTSTTKAMTLGMHSAIRGMVAFLIERYAEAYGAYPQIVATGGDSALLFRDDPLVEHVVSDLQLQGIWLACSRALLDDDTEPEG